MTGLKPFNRILSILCLCLLYTICHAQGKAKDTWGKIGPEDFSATNAPSIVAANASAIILSDQGFINFVGNKVGWFSHVYQRHTRIKILNKSALALATVAVEFYAPDENPEKLTDVKASAYNLENGQVTETKLESKDIFEERVNKQYSKIKFSIPGVKEGSIIEYSYRLTSPYDQLPSWEFQWEDYPCLYSDLQVEIPQTMLYVLVRQGVHPYAVDKGSEGHINYLVTQKSEASLGGTDQSLTVSATTVKHEWTMKDLPAFGSERFLTTADNYIDKISFQLSGWNGGEEVHPTTNTWAKATEELLNREDFGGAISADNSWMDVTLDKVAPGTLTPLEQARAIYYYVSRHFTCTNHYDFHVRTNLHDVVKKSSGTVGDINLLLVAMLRRKGMTVDPVLLSTRDHGFNLSSYPILQKLNYVVAQLRIDGRTFYLDAAYPQLGFGQLAGACYNGHARVISKEDSASLWFWADSLKESKFTVVMLSGTDKGLEGTWQSTLGKEESYQTRIKIAESGVESYFKNIQTAWGEDGAISNPGIDSIDRPEDPVKIHYDFEMKTSADAGTLYINPILGGGWHENPFAAADRKYPVEMPYVIDETYILSMQLPEGFAVEEVPKSTRVMYNGDQGSFEYLVQQTGDQLQLRARLKLNRATFQPEDYSSLRDFFGFVVKKENEQIVLKKK
ncbi:MAG TPA: DUF3857 domain-containing protein [Puia sp.]|uniref:DUF3857 domain-containing protein n=1 Tax=Puia sp. TaxID=2045100 RepID=UPI002BD24994|nr:DUF3857 domain-containing protein [Puia sp.]HVU96631.1 DUF3857 domain-containing protein [Puia sp.]